jgi:dTDP-4-amino-4,6-dideoxygalactose transaminase
MYRGLASAHPSNLPIANDRASKILCLPIYPTLTQDEQLFIVDLIKRK